MNYIMIMEDGHIYKSDVVTDDDKHACDSGILDIIDTETSKQYFEDDWHDLEVWGDDDDVETLPYDMLYQNGAQGG